MPIIRTYTIGDEGFLDREATEEELREIAGTGPASARTVTRRQFMMALYVWQLKEAAEALVSQAGGITAVAWASATDFQIDDPMLINLVTQLGKADQLEEFFDFAATL